MYKFHTHNLKKKAGAKGENLQEGNLARSINCAKASWAIGEMTSELQFLLYWVLIGLVLRMWMFAVHSFPKEIQDKGLLNPWEMKQVLMKEDLFQ